MLKNRIQFGAPQPLGECARYPLDRTDLHANEWDFEMVLSEARAAGYVVPRALLRAWVRGGYLPQPRAIANGQHHAD